MEPSWSITAAFLFSAIRKSKTHSNISLLLKPRKDSQSFIQGAGFAFAASSHHAGIGFAFTRRLSMHWIGGM